MSVLREGGLFACWLRIVTDFDSRSLTHDGIDPIECYISVVVVLWRSLAAYKIGIGCKFMLLDGSLFPLDLKGFG